MLFEPIEVPGIEIRIAVVLIFMAILSYFDIFNKKWIPNKILYAFLISAFLLNIMFFTQEVFISALLISFLAFLLTYPLYKLGHLGGADVYAYSAVSLAIPYLPKPLLSSPQLIFYPFIFSVIAPTGIFFISHMLIRFIPYVMALIKTKKIAFSLERFFAPFIILISFLFFIYSLFLMPFKVPLIFILFVLFLFFSLFFFSIFKEEIKNSMVEYVVLSSAYPEDVIAIEKLDQNLVKKLGLSPVLTEASIKKLKEAKIKKIPVFTKMPFFIPYLFLGILFTCLFGDLVFLIIYSGF